MLIVSTLLKWCCGPAGRDCSLLSVMLQIFLCLTKYETKQPNVLFPSAKRWDTGDLISSSSHPFNAFIELCIKIDVGNVLRREEVTPCAVPLTGLHITGPEIAISRYSPDYLFAEKKSWCWRNSLCLYCRNLGHVAFSCPLKTCLTLASEDH